MPQVVLDPKSLSEPISNGIEVKTEIEFLQHVEDDATLLIRGNLCEWAQRYYDARGIPFSFAASPIADLLNICPNLTESQAEEILRKHRPQIGAHLDHLSISGLLERIFPDSLWEEKPSIEQFARYLLWLLQNQPGDYIAPLFQHMGEIWEEANTGQVYIPYRHFFNAEKARQAILEWLAILPSNQWSNYGAFPAPVPPEFRHQAVEAWKRQIISSDGQFFIQLANNELPYSLMKDAAKETAEFLAGHSSLLTKLWIEKLKPYLSSTDMDKLHRLVPPEVPNSLPEEHGEVIQWFLDGYLPYREWQIVSNDQEARIVADKLARDFAEWYLRAYPEMIIRGSGQEALSYNKSGALSSREKSCVTLIVLMDGLGIADSRQVVSKVQEQIPKLFLKENSAAFTAMPTVTEFCKSALIRSVPPRFTDSAEPIGTIIPERKWPAPFLKDAKQGDLFIWSILEPDETYHTYADRPVLKRNVEAQIDGVILKVLDVVNEAPRNLQLEVIFTSDHGRLMTSSQRKTQVPEGMISHGRAAWGQLNKEFPREGFIIENDLVYLHAGRFGLPSFAVMPLDDSTFLTSDGKVGTEFYSHGGLFPEEIIVPWIEFTRDVVRPKIDVKVTGTGYAESNGTLSIEIYNLSSEEIGVEALEISSPKFGKHVAPIGRSMPMSDRQVLDISVDWWPTKKQAEKLSGRLFVTVSNGVRFIYPCDADIEINELYSSDNDILSSLE